MDSLSKERRSWNMSRIRSRDTRPEQIVRAILHRAGFRFRLDSGRKLVGRPDIVLPKHRAVVLVHGCFWHRHRSCGLAYMPKSRVEFWSAKFSANTRRDAEVRRRLSRAGWNVVVVWECQLRDRQKLAQQLVRAIRQP
jgi:DNA mismatch endonuclease (patch repair protein)